MGRSQRRDDSCTVGTVSEDAFVDKVADSPKCFMGIEAKFRFQFSPLTTELKKKNEINEIFFVLTGVFGMSL